MRPCRSILAVAALLGALPALFAGQVSAAPEAPPAAATVQKPIEPGGEKKSDLWAVVEALLVAVGGGGGIAGIIGAIRAKRSAKETKSSLENLEEDFRNILTSSDRSKDIWPLITTRIAQVGIERRSLASAILDDFSEPALRSGLKRLMEVEDHSNVARLVTESPTEQLKTLTEILAELRVFTKGLEN